MPIPFADPTLQSNEMINKYETPDDLGKAYVDLNTRVSGGSIDLLPEDMRKDPALNVFKTLPDLAKGYLDTKKMVGGIEKAPEKPEGYKLTPMTGLHANLKAEGIVKALLPIFHASGAGNTVTDKIQQGVLTHLSNMITNQEKIKKENSLKAETELRTEWGADYDAKFDKIVKTMQVLGGPEMASETEAISSAMKGSPKFLKGMGKLIGLLSEDSLKSLGTDGAAPITNAAQAQEEINKYMKEITAGGTTHPYFNDKDPKHEEALKKMHDLHALMQSK